MKTDPCKLIRALKKTTKADHVRLVTIAPVIGFHDIRAIIVAMDFKKPGPAQFKYPTLKEEIAQIMPTIYPESIQSDCICDWDLTGGWASYLHKSLYTTYLLTLYTEL